MSKIIVANFKMHLTLIEIKDYLKKVTPRKNIIICPSNIYIPYFLANKFTVGSQNIHEMESGAYTGEVSAKQLKSMNVCYSIIGHSERRKYFHETDNIINQKVNIALKNNLKVILCIGEDENEKNHKEFLTEQLKKALQNVTNFDNIIIAYEPIWAINTGITPSSNALEQTIKHIKETIKTLYQNDTVKVLYGGSVNEENVEILNKIPNIDGFLVGNSSLSPKVFKKIIEVVDNQ